MAEEYLSAALNGINNFIKRTKEIVWGDAKLVRMLNDYEDEKELVCGRRNYKWHYNQDEDCIYAERVVDGSMLGTEESRSVIICRGYCFIKWLVENDKIDLLQLDNRIALSMSIEFNKVERVLMALSISDTPIDDLISYLK